MCLGDLSHQPPALLGTDSPSQSREDLVKLLQGGGAFANEMLVRRGDVTPEGRHSFIEGGVQAGYLNHAFGVEGDHAILDGDRGAQRVYRDRGGQGHQPDHHGETDGYLLLKRPRTDHRCLSLAGSTSPARFRIVSASPGISNTARTAGPIRTS